MIEEMTRFLESYNLDDLVKVVWMNSTDHSMLSKGTDLKFILHKVKEKEDHQAVLYLSEIQKLAAYIAGYQKIFIPILNGDISGSLAAMLVNSPFSLSSQNV
jgi:enoyl-CoA hydratase/carnithine racemase